MEQLSFQPKINQISRQMLRQTHGTAEDNLINYGKQVKERREEKRIENLRKEVDGLSF